VRFDPANPSIVAVDPHGASAAEAAPSAGNPFRDRYEEAQVVGRSLLPGPKEPSLYLGTADMPTDFQKLFENDYALLGGAQVRNATDPEAALEQGREIGAAMVVLYGHFAPPEGTEIELLPFRRRSSGIVPPRAVSMRFAMGRLGPEDQLATYWGKTRPAILGIVSRSLDPNEQARLRRQDGILVESVSMGSPAEAARIAVGDIVVAIDGRPVDDPRAVPGIVTSLAGQRVALDLLRDGSPMSVIVTLNPATP
jgi:S1-C subfamily serine protease